MPSIRRVLPARTLFLGYKPFLDSTPSPQWFRRTLHTAPEAVSSESSMPPFDIHLEATSSAASGQPNFAVTATKQSSISPAERFQAQPNPFLHTAVVTTQAFPSLEPLSYVRYPSTHLLVPLRKDILHRAVIFEGDAARQGTASTKWRSEVHGSNHKIRPQKGTGKARLGDKKSPMLRGGGVAFGPKPRDFSTDLPRKVYDLAWRTALSYRYRRGELIVLKRAVEIQCDEASLERFVGDLLRWHKLDKTGGRSLFVTSEKRPQFFSTLLNTQLKSQSRALVVEDVDVKDLLETGKVVIEKEALDYILQDHQSDLRPNERLKGFRRKLKKINRA